MPIHRYISILAIIGVAAAVFAAEIMRAADFAGEFGAVPVHIHGAWQKLVSGNGDVAAAKALSQLVTAVFLHADPEHLLFNMVFLWVFGVLVSQQLGQWRTLAVYMFCGICGNVLQVCLNLQSPIPIIGASGAVCGLAGAYLGFALRWQLPWPDVWPLAHPIPPLQLGAFALIGFATDMYFLANHAQQIAYGAHVGGFLSGLAIAAAITALFPSVESYQRGRRKTNVRR